MEKICPLVKGQCTVQYCEFWVDGTCLPREAWKKYIGVPEPAKEEPKVMEEALGTLKKNRK
jgi:hypothetical protein